MNSLPKLKDQGFKIFKQNLFRLLCDKTTEAIIDEIYKQRNEELAIDID